MKFINMSSKKVEMTKENLSSETKSEKSSVQENEMPEPISIEKKSKTEKKMD